MGDCDSPVKDQNKFCVELQRGMSVYAHTFTVHGTIVRPGELDDERVIYLERYVHKMLNSKNGSSAPEMTRSNSGGAIVTTVEYYST